MGKAAAKQSQELQSEAANRFSDLSTQLANEAAPGRQAAENYYTGIASGDRQKTYNAIAPQVDFTKRQFANARQTLDAGVAPGGARQRGYNQLASAEAGNISNLFRDKINEAVARLSDLSQGNTQSAISSTGGVSNAGTALGQLAAARGQAVASSLGGISGALGTFFGLRPSGGSTSMGGV